MISEAVKRLRHPDKREREKAVEVCVAAGRPAIPVVRPLLSDPSWVVRYRAAEIIGRIGGEEAPGLLIPLLKDEKDHVRYMAVRGLCRCADASVIPEILPRCSDGNEFVRAMAQQAIEKLKNQRPR